MKEIISRKNACTLVGLFAAGTLLNFFVQAASMQMNVGDVFDWIWNHGFLFWIGCFVMFFLMLAVAAVTSSVYAGPLAVVVIVGLIATADNKKLGTTGEPLFPWDLLMVKNASAMRDITKGMISPLAIAGTLVALAALGYLIYRLPRVRFKLGIRVVYAVVSIVAVLGFVHTLSGNHAKLFARVGYSNYFWNPRVNYAENGFLFAFAADLKQTLMDKPDGYSEKNVKAIAEKYRDMPDMAPAPAAKVEQPNIMFVMDEAFFDASRLTAYKLSEDPLPTLHELRKSIPSGWNLSPEFGGSTANVEFEALTGLSNYFLQGGTIPYQQAIVRKSSMPSIVSILKARGYSALALHPFDKTFYNRNQVYPVLGFEQFIGSKDMPDAQRITNDGYVTDKSAFEEAIKQLKNADKPTFLHLVTMQNHYPFIEGKNGPNTITADGLQGSRKTEFETYVQDTKLTDEALSYLVGALKEIERPTIVVMWGDHLPALSEDIYKGAGWGDDQKRRHETPLLFFANFDMGQKWIGSMSPSFIGPTVFELTGQSMPPFYKLLEKVKAQVPGLNRSVLTTSDAVLPALNAEQQALVDDYRMIEYDLLLGEGYSRDILFPGTDGK